MREKLGTRGLVAESLERRIHPMMVEGQLVSVLVMVALVGVARVMGAP